MICKISSRIIIWMLTTYCAKANFWIRRPTVCIIVTKKTDSCPRMPTNTIIWNREGFESLFFFCNNLLGKPWHGPFPGLFPLKTMRSPIFLPPTPPPLPSPPFPIPCGKYWRKKLRPLIQNNKKGEKTGLVLFRLNKIKASMKSLYFLNDYRKESLPSGLLLVCCNSPPVPPTSSP